MDNSEASKTGKPLNSASPIDRLVGRLDPFRETHFSRFKHSRFRFWLGTRELWVQIWKYAFCIHWGGRETGKTFKLVG